MCLSLKVTLQATLRTIAAQTHLCRSGLVFHFLLQLGSIRLQVSSGSELSIDSSSSVVAGLNVSFGGNVNVTGSSTFVVSGDATFHNGSGVVSFARGGFGDLKSGSGVPVS